MMTARAHAVYTIFNHLTDSTYERANRWFKEHPNEPYCYWAKDEFIAIKDKDNQELLKQHPEIDDINDHTMIKPRPDGRGNILYGFCPDLKQSIKELVAAGVTSGMTDTGLYWRIELDPERPGNYIGTHIKTRWSGTRQEWDSLTDNEKYWFLASEGIS